MKTLTASQFDSLIGRVNIAPRLRREVRFEPSTARLGSDWSDCELVAVTDKTGRSGVLLLQPADDMYAIQFELASLSASSTTGRVRSIICDFCYSWQRGSNAASIMLQNRNTKRSVRYLCCADLECSRHVRTQTEAGRLSRTQLRESLDDDGRVERLKRKLTEKITDLDVRPVTIE